jgi:hypothetical protein
MKFTLYGWGQRTLFQTLQAEILGLVMAEIKAKRTSYTQEEAKEIGAGLVDLFSLLFVIPKVRYSRLPAQALAAPRYNQGM